MPEDIPVSDIPAFSPTSLSLAPPPVEEEEDFGARSFAQEDALQNLAPPEVEPDPFEPVKLDVGGLTPGTPEGRDLGALQSQVSAERPYTTEEDDDEIPNEAELNRLMDSYDVYQPAHERVKTRQKIDRYFAHQKQIAWDSENERIKRMATDPEGRRELTDTPEMKAAMNRYRDQPVTRNALVDQTIVSQYMNHLAGRELRTPEEKDAFRNSWGKERTGDPTTSHATALTLMQTDFKNQDERKKMGERVIGLALADLAESATTGKSSDPLKSIKQLESEFPDQFTEQTRSALYSSYGEVQRRARKLFNKHPEASKTATLVLQDFLNDTPDNLHVLQMRAALHGIPSTDRQQILNLAAMAARAKLPPGDAGKIENAIHNISKALGEASGIAYRATGGYGTVLADSKLDAEKQALEDGTARLDSAGNIVLPDPEYKGPAFRKPTPKETSELWHDRKNKRDDLQLARELEQVKGELDPYHPIAPEGWMRTLEMGTYSLIEQAPDMGLLALPGGPLLYTMAAGTRYYDQMLRENPGMDPFSAMGISMGAARIEAITEAMELKSMAGAGIMAKNFQHTLRTKGPLIALKEFAGTTFEQNTQELVQDATTTMIFTVASNLRPDMSDKDIAQEFRLMLEQRDDVAAMLFIPTLVGAGFATHRVLKHPDRAIYTPEKLARSLITKEWQERILNSTNADDRDAMFRQAWDEKTPESVKESLALIEADIDAAQNVPEDMPQATLEQVVNDKGEVVYNVIGPTGDIIHKHLTEDIAIKEQQRINQDLANEFIAASQIKKTSEESARVKAEAGADLEVLDVEGREVAETSPAATIDFDRPTPGVTVTDAGLDRLNKKVQKEQPGLQLREVIPSMEQISEVGISVMDAVKALQSFTGRRVRFVEDVNENELFFRGVVDPDDPNTIWIDARGTRSTLAIFGHEFTHTLEKTNPTLYAEFVKAIEPFIGDLALEHAKIAKRSGGKYTPGQLSKEYIANIAGDAFAHPELLNRLAKSNPGLFSRIIAALRQWFQSFKEHASTFGTETAINVEKVHEQMASLLEKVKAAGPERGPSATEPRIDSDELQFTLSRAPSVGNKDFKDWFKRSVVVDKYGNPMIVYHGTKGDFTVFRHTGDLGFHFGTVQAANDRLESTLGIAGYPGGQGWKSGNIPGGDIKARGASIIPVYLSIQNPVRLPDLGDWDVLELIDELEERDAISHAQSINIEREYGTAAKMSALRRTLLDNGIDGIVYKNTGEGQRRPTPEEMAGVQVEIHEFPATPAHPGGFMAYAREQDMERYGDTPEQAEAELREIISLSDRIPWDDSYIIFEPWQAKSATGNVGVYWEGEGDIMLARREDPEAAKYRMQIDRGVREVAAIGHYSDAEKGMVGEAVRAQLDKMPNVPKHGKKRSVIEAEMLAQVEADIRGKRRQNPDKVEPKTESDTGVTLPWAHVDITGVQTVFTPKGGARKKDFVKAVAKWKKIPFSFEKVPAGMTMEEYTSGLATKMVDEFFARLARGGKNAQTILDQIGWYRNVIVNLRKEYGGFSDMFADFLGGFSPATGVVENWKNAVGFLEAVTNGKYDALFEELHAWDAAGKTIKQWRDAGKPIPLKENGLTLFGSNTNNGLAAVLKMWREVKFGDPPKARNFTKNLIGQSIHATIDRWAARMLQRLAGHERIPIGMAESGVTGSHRTPEKFEKAMGIPDVSGQELPPHQQFGVGQVVFAKATEMMIARDPVLFAGLLPSDMQAMNWFVEKEFWGEMNWSNEAGEGGSFEEMMKWQNVQRFVVGLSQTVEGHPTQPTFIPDTHQNVAFGERLRKRFVDKLKQKGQFLAVRAKDSLGMFEQKPERSLDTELLTGLNIEPMDIVRITAEEAGQAHQKSTFVARVIKDHEPENANARPGIEVYFDHEVSMAEVQPVMDYLVAQGIDGFTAIVDARSRPNPTPGAGGPDQVWGVRMMYIPEYAVDGHDLAEDWAQEGTKVHHVLEDAADELAKLQGVAHAVVLQYDTVVLKTGLDYDERGIIETSLGREIAEAWRGRFQRASTAQPTGQPAIHEEGQAGVGDRGVPSGGAGGERGPPEAGAEGSDLEFARREGKFEQARAEGPLDRGASIEAIFEQIHTSPQRKAETTARAYRAYQIVRQRHEAEIAGYQPPEVPDLGKAITELEGQEGLARQNLDLEEQADIDASIQAASDEYDGPIADARDAVAKKALEREKRLFLSRKRKGIEAVYAERAKALAEAYAIRRQNIKTTVAQAQTMATAEGSAELKRRRRVQTFAELNAILRAIPSDIRGKLGIGMTPSLEGMTEEALVDFLGDRIKRIGAELERSIKADFVASIEDLLDRAKPKKTAGGVLKGAVGDAHRALQAIRQIKDMDNDAVALGVSGIEAQLTTPGLEPEQQERLSEQQHLLMLFGDLSNRTAAELETAHAVLQAIIQQGRTQWYLVEKRRLDKQRAQGQMILDAIGTTSTAALAKMKREENLLSLAGGYINSHFSLIQLFQEQMPDLPFIKEWSDRARRADEASKDFARESTERLSAVVRAASGTTTVYGAGKVIQKMQVANVQGKANDPPMTQLEAIQYLLSWEQSDVRGRMEYHGWDEAAIQRLRDATADSTSQAVMNFLRQEYAASWATLNPVYKAMYGVDMPRIPNYAPTRYHHTGTEQDIDVFGGPTATSGMTASFVHARINHKAELRQMDAMHVYMQHMAQAGHFVHFAELMREMKGTLNNPEVKKSLEQHMGSGNYKTLNMWIDSLQRNGANKAGETEAITKFVGAITKAKAVSSMGFNARTLIMQTDSLFRWIAEIPLKAWLPSLFDSRLWSNIHETWKSDTIQRRVREGMTPDMQYVMQQGKLTPSLFLEMGRIGFYPMRWVDGVFTSASSGLIYTYHYNEAIKAGMTPDAAQAEAADRMDAAVHKLSQPTHMTAKGLHEVNAGAIMKMILMFTSDPRLKFAIEAQAIQQIFKGQDVAMNFQRVGAVMVWAMISQLMGNLYRAWATDSEEEIFQWDEFLTAAAFAPFQGLFLVGSLSSSTVALFTDKPAPKNADPLTEAVTRMKRVYKNADQLLNTEDLPKLLKTWDDLLRVSATAIPQAASVAALINPVKTAVGVIENIKEP